MTAEWQCIEGGFEIPGVLIPGRSTEPCSLRIEGTKVASIQKDRDGEVSWVALPPLFDSHVHANRAYSLGGQHPASFEHAVEMTRSLFGILGVEECEGYADRLFRRLFENGTTRVRTHADVAPEIGLKALEGTMAAAQTHTRHLDIEIVAFGSLDPTVPEDRKLLEMAIDAGATHLGGVPLLCDDPAAAINSLLDMARTLHVPVDLHLDEHLDDSQCFSGHLADAVMARGLEGRVTLSHGCAIASLEPDTAADVLGRIKDAGIAVVTLPTTNLYLQDRGQGTPRRRGLTLIREMLALGIPVRIASDNVQDAFYPYGDGDLLEIAQLAVAAGHLEDPVQVVAGITGGREPLKAGDAADFVLVAGRSFDAMLAERSKTRIVFQGGKPVVAAGDGKRP